MRRVLRTACGFRARDGDIHTVIDVENFLFEEKFQVALRCENGSVETTLLNFTAGILKPSSGIIRIVDREMSTRGENSFALAALRLKQSRR